MNKLLVAVFACVALATPVRAEDHGQMNELLFDGSQGTIGFNGTTSINAKIGYNYQFMPGWQIGLAPNISFTDNGVTSSTTWGARAVITANFPMEWTIDEAIFVTGNIGVEDQGTGLDVAFGGGIGKRFKLAEHVTYRPSVYVDKVGAGKLRIFVSVLSFSAVW